MPQRDTLRLTVAKTRRVQQDGLHFQSHRYMDINLAAFVKEEVLIRYEQYVSVTSRKGVGKKDIVCIRCSLQGNPLHFF